MFRYITAFIAMIFALSGCDSVSVSDDNVLLSNLTTEPCSPDAIDCTGGGGGPGGGTGGTNPGVCPTSWKGNYRIGSGNEDRSSQKDLGTITANNRTWVARIKYSHNAYSSSGRLRANAMTQLQVKCSSSGTDLDQWWTPNTSDFPSYKVKAQVYYFNSTVLDPYSWNAFIDDGQGNNIAIRSSRFNVVFAATDSDTYSAGFVHTKTEDSGGRLYNTGVIYSLHEYSSNNWTTRNSVGTFVGKSYPSSCPGRSQSVLFRNDSYGSSHTIAC